MSKSPYPLRLPTSIKTAAARLAKADGVSLNQFIASAVAEKVGVIETAREFLERSAGDAKPKDLLKYLRKVSQEGPAESDRRWQMDEIRTGIKQLEEGRGVPHRDVANWLRSWGRQRQRKAPRKMTIAWSTRHWSMGLWRPNGGHSGAGILGNE